jgi:hypothetical protein
MPYHRESPDTPSQRDWTGITIPAPIPTLDRTLLVGVGLNRARIDGEAFTAN